MNKIRIPSILHLKVTDILLSDFTVETEFYNLYFAAQCTPIDNSSKFKFKIYEEKPFSPHLEQCFNKNDAIVASCKLIFQTVLIVGAFPEK